MFLKLDVALVEAEFFAVGDADLLFDQVDARDFFGDGMFDLNAGVHLDEVVISLRIDEELNGAGVLVISGFGGADGRFTHFFTQIGRQKRRRRFFDQFLMAALHRAIAFAEVDDLTVGIGQDLKFDVPGLLDVLLDINLAVAEGFFGFVAGDVVFFGEGDVVVRDAHAAATAAGDSFDDYRITDFAGDFNRFGFRIHRAIRARYDRYACFSDGVFGDRLITHHFDGFRFGADKLDVTRFALLGEFGVFGEKAVAGVDGVDVSDFGGADDAIGAKVAIGALGTADADRLIGQLHVQGLHVGLGIDGEGFYAQFSASTYDA